VWQRSLLAWWRGCPQARLYAGLYALALLVRLALAWPVAGPSYFDAAYYQNAAESLIAGHGLIDQVIWNYLDDPAGLPRPSHLYWPPLNTWLAALGLLLNGWRGVQAVFIALSALLVPLAACLAWSLWRRRDYAIAAGLLVLFSGHYAGYWGSAPDSFGPFALIIAGAILAAVRGWWLPAGLCTGLAALTRADGLLIALVLGATALWQRNWRGAVAVSIGCLLVLAPWWVRNWLVAGTPFPGGGLKTLWLRDYEELFYLGQELTVSRYLAWGVGPILVSKFQAAWYNLYVMLGPWPYLAPLAVLGAWQGWHDRRLRLGFGYGLALWLALTLGFTFPAQHGSTFHSAGALVIWQAACVPAGVAAVMRWLARRWPRWDAARFTRFFLVRLTALAVVVSLIQYGLIWLRVIRPEMTVAGWVNHGLDHYVVVDRWLNATDVSPAKTVLVRDPPTFYHATGRRAVVLPRDLAFLDPTANRYGVRCAILEDACIGRLRVAQDEGHLTEWQEAMTASGRSNAALFCREGAP
jgi:hypothetical protein